MLADRKNIYGSTLVLLTIVTAIAAQRPLNEAGHLSWSKKTISDGKAGDNSSVGAGTNAKTSLSTSMRRRSDGSSGGVGYYAAGVTAIAGATTLVCNFPTSPASGAACAVGLIATMLSGLAGVLRGLASRADNSECYIVDGSGNKLFDATKCNLGEIYSYEDLKSHWLQGLHPGNIHLADMSVGDGNVYQMHYSYNPYVGGKLFGNYNDFYDAKGNILRRDQEYKGFHQLTATVKDQLSSKPGQIINRSEHLTDLPDYTTNGGAKATYLWRDWDYAQERAVADHPDNLQDIAYKIAYDDPKVETYEVFELNLYNGDAIAECGVLTLEPEEYNLPNRQELLEDLCTSAPI